MTGWSTGQYNDWLVSRSIQWLAGQQVNTMTGWSAGQYNGWLVNRSIQWLAGQQVNTMTGWSTGQYNALGLDRAVHYHTTGSGNPGLNGTSYVITHGWMGKCP